MDRLNHINLAFIPGFVLTVVLVIVVSLYIEAWRAKERAKRHNRGQR